MEELSKAALPKRTPFPEHLKALRQLMPELRHILEAGHESDWYAFIWLEEAKTLSSNCGTTEKTEEFLDRGMVFRVLANGIHYERSTNQLTPNHLKQLAADFRKMLESEVASQEHKGYAPLTWKEELNTPLHPVIQDQLPESLDDESWVHFGVPCQVQPEETTVETLKEMAQSCRQRILKRSQDFIDHSKTNGNGIYSPLADIQVMARLAIKTHIFVDRQKNMSQVLPVSRLYATSVVTSGQSARSMAGGMGGVELAEFSDTELDEVAITTLKLTKANKIEPGRYQIISGPDVTGVIAHEAFGHTQEGDTWMKGRSIAQNLRNDDTRVGNDHASIVNQADIFSMDDRNYGTNGSYFFDHEGQLSRAQTILDKGFLSTPMTDLTSAILLDVPRTANGKRESWRRPLMTRQTNTFFTPGDKSVDELIAMVEHGFLARHAYGGMEDPKGGSLTAGTAYLEEIKDGKLTGNLFLGPNGGHIELSDPVFQLLERIVAKSHSPHNENIPENTLGGCGKYHKELVDAGCGGPFILWESINCG